MKLKPFLLLHCPPIFLTVWLTMSFCAQSMFAQVSPAELLSPDLKALQQTKFQALITLYLSGARVKFPYPF